MLFKRDRVMFKADISLPDPELLKFQFRRRVFFLALVGATLLLGIPVLRDRLPALATDKEIRHLAQWILEIRLESQRTHTSYALSLDENSSQLWTRLEYPVGASCEKDPAPVPPQVRSSTGFSWRILLQGEAPKDVHKLCFDPLQGLLVDGTPVGDQSVAIVVGPAADKESGRLDRLKHLVLSQQGSSLELNPKL